jgi:sigma-B regulation protein RsbU (phosphoserine phosphatase)
VNEAAAPKLAPDELAAVLDGLPDGVTVFDADWTLRYINPAAAALIKRPATELVGRGLGEALPEVAGSIFHSFCCTPAARTRR